MANKNTAVLGAGVLGTMVLGQSGGDLFLITDRTAEDVRRWSELSAKGFANMTDSERTEWLSGMKGAYNASDLNRVGQAVLSVAAKLRNAGNVISVSVKTDWTTEDIPTEGEMSHYTAEVNRVRNVIAVYPSTPVAPLSAVGLNYKEANNIEKILVDVDQLIKNMQAAYYYSGELYGGERHGR